MIRQLAEWGFTAVRLGAMWTGLEPEEEGGVNETYVEVLQEVVEGLGSQGIYTYLDMHQVWGPVSVWLESKKEAIPPGRANRGGWLLGDPPLAPCQDDPPLPPPPPAPQKKRPLQP